MSKKYTTEQMEKVMEAVLSKNETTMAMYAEIEELDRAGKLPPGQTALDLLLERLQDEGTKK